MNINNIKDLKHGDVLHHVTATNADSTPVRCRVNGKLKLWKRDPLRFKLPVKHGLNNCFYIEPCNCHEWVKS